MKRLKYPCILEVSQTEDFSIDPHMKHGKKQVCICKLGGKFVSVQSKEEDLDWMLEQIKNSIKSGSISGLVLEYWNYARKNQFEISDYLDSTEMIAEYLITVLEEGDNNDLIKAIKHITDARQNI